MTKLLVAAGDATQKSVEIINLDEFNPNLICDDLPNLPNSDYGPTGQLLMGKNPIICTGLGNECSCHSYQNGSWKINGIAKNCGQYASSTILSVSDDHEVFFVTGGFNDDGKLNSVETFDGNIWRLTYLPEPLVSHCIVKINSTVFFSVGGTYSNRTFFYNALDNNWIPGPSMKVPRAGLSCGLLTWKNPLADQLDKVVVVAGGSDGDTNWSSTELLLLIEDGTHNKEWIDGPELPNATFGSRMIEYQDSVILVGGSNLEKKLFQLFSPKGPWIQMKQTLKTERSYHVAFLVPDDIVNCHK